MTPPVARADRTLGLVGVLLAMAAYLADRARGDIRDAREELLAERHRRADAEDLAEQRRQELDGALERLHEVTNPAAA